MSRIPSYIHPNCQNIIAKHQIGKQRLRNNNNNDDTKDTRIFAVTTLSDDILVQAETVLLKHKMAPTHQKTLLAQSVYNQTDLEPVLAFSTLVKKHTLTESNQIMKRGRDQGVILKSYNYQHEIQTAVEDIERSTYRFKSQDEVCSVIAQVMQAKGLALHEPWLKLVIDTSILMKDLGVAPSSSSSTTTTTAESSSTTETTATSAETSTTTNGKNTTTAAVASTTTAAMVPASRNNMSSRNNMIMAQSGIMQPGDMMQSGFMQPGIMQPGIMQPGITMQQAMMQSGITMQQAMMQSGIMQPGVVMPPAMMPQAMFPPAMMQPAMMHQPGMVPFSMMPSILPQQMGLPTVASSRSINEQNAIAGINMMHSYLNKREDTQKKQAEADIKRSEAQIKQSEADKKRSEAQISANEAIQNTIREEGQKTRGAIERQGNQTRSTFVASAIKLPPSTRTSGAGADPSSTNPSSTTTNRTPTQNKKTDPSSTNPSSTIADHTPTQSENTDPSSTNPSSTIADRTPNTSSQIIDPSSEKKSSPLQPIDLNAQQVKLEMITALQIEYKQDRNDRQFKATDIVLCDGKECTIVGTTAKRVYMITNDKLKECGKDAIPPTKKDVFYKSNKNVQLL